MKFKPGDKVDFISFISGYILPDLPFPPINLEVTDISIKYGAWLIRVENNDKWYLASWFEKSKPKVESFTHPCA